MEKYKPTVLKAGAFLCAGLVIGGYIKMQREVSQLTADLVLSNTKVSALAQTATDLETKLAATNFELDKAKGSITILDGAVNSEGKRKARINKVKQIIRDVSLKEGLKEAASLEASQLAEMATAIVDRADAEHIPVPLLMGLIRQESAFNPEAVSPKGAQGLTQVMPTTADDIKQWTARSYYEPFRISHNIHFGAYYLGRMMRKFGWNQNRAVMAYNGGPEAVASWVAGVGKLWPETIDYEKQVMDYARKYESMGAI
jgi:hypothetical protein